MTQQDRAFARLLGSIYTQTFQRKPLNPNKPISVSAHEFYEQTILDDTKLRLITNTGHTVIYGPGGTSDEVNGGSGTAGRYSFTGWYS